MVLIHVHIVTASSVTSIKKALPMLSQRCLI